MLSIEELSLLKLQGITEDEFNKQIESFRNGFPEIEILDSARIGDGIEAFEPENRQLYISKWDEYLNAKDSKGATKFVPASGAASRMFKGLFEYLRTGEESDFIKAFFAGIKKFPFYDQLNTLCEQEKGKDIDSLLNNGRGQDVVSIVLTNKAMDFGNKPKGVIPFHKAGADVRTPFEEHLEESSQYTKDNGNNIEIHFTVSQNHLQLFNELLEKNKQSFVAKNGINNLDVEFSFQDPSTDTIAVDLNNVPLKQDGKFLFRPGGHGSLLKNLNELNTPSGIVFIKNIDNVVPSSKRSVVIESTKMLGGYLLALREKIWHFSDALSSDNISDNLLAEIKEFCSTSLHIKGIPNLEKHALAHFLKGKLDRPLRVCGMVENKGEQGGGPYFCKNADSTYSLQILERNQINDNNPIHLKALKSSTHFNPVNIVCSIIDRNGRKYDLTKYVDENTAFITTKSQQGKELKALEHPGLWNGSMSDWNTVFVEMEEETFNPVKTVNDLLRPMHQE